MTVRLLAACLTIALSVGAGLASAQETTTAPPEKNADPPPKPDSAGSPTADTTTTKPATTTQGGKPMMEKATLGAGCFWSIEAVFERVPGVRNVTSGFSGGNVPFPSYAQVCTGQTGHAEVVQIEYDASVVTYEELLKLYFKAHDPTTLNSQGDDFGTQYRSAIFFHNDDQRKAALKMYQDLTTRRAFRSPIVTDLVPYTMFFPAEAYHQAYYRNHRGDFYTSVYIEPKLKKLKLTGKSPAPAKRAK
jgi:peptide-methionine (S)-S-oxide reductase